MNGKMIICAMAVLAMLEVAFAAATVSGVKARQRYPWNGMVDIDCTVTGTAGTPYSLTVNARDKVGGTNLTVKTVNVEGESVTGNPVSVTSGVYRLVWNADTDLPNGFRGEKVSISVTVTDSAKKFMIVDLQTGAITYQSAAPEGGWDVDEYKGAKMAFVRIEPGTFTQYSIEGLPGREVTITKPYYMGILPVTHKQLRTLVGASYWYEFTTGTGVGILCTYNDDTSYYTASGYSRSTSDSEFSDRWAQNATFPYRAVKCGRLHCKDLVYSSSPINSLLMKMWPMVGHNVDAGSPIGVLRSRTGLQKFDLPTEAQVTKARESVVWSGGTLCLDCWWPWLGTTPESDPLGRLMCDMSTSYYNVSTRYSGVDFYLTCISQTTRCSSRDISPYARFCLYEAD